MRRWGALVFHACSRCGSAASRNDTAFQFVVDFPQEVPSSLRYAQWLAASSLSRSYRASAWLSSQQSQASSTSNWDVGQPPVDEKHTQRGEPKLPHPAEETPSSTLGKEINTLDMMHANARETQERLSHKGDDQTETSDKDKH